MKFLSAAVPAICFAFMPLTAGASAILLNEGPGVLSSVGGGPPGSTHVTYGYDFTVGSTSILVTSLGLWDANANGLTDAHTVRLWTISGALVASVSVSSGTAAELVGSFRYSTLSVPVTLYAGQQYVLGASYPISGTDQFIQNVVNPQNFDGAVSSGTARDVVGLDVFPDHTNPGMYSFVGPNAQFKALPEPSAALLMLSFAAFLGSCRKRGLKPD